MSSGGRAGAGAAASIGAALAAGVDGLDEERFADFKSEAALASPSLGWCQRMKTAERDALAELTAADTMEMQLASLRRQDTPGHRATQGGLLGSVRRCNLFDSPATASEQTSRLDPEVASPDGSSPNPSPSLSPSVSPTVETLRLQLSAAEQARSVAEQQHDQLSREMQEIREKAGAEIQAERNRAIEALAVAEEARAVADSAAQRCAESDRLLAAMRAEAAATRVATEHEQEGMLSAVEVASLRTELAAQEECRWAAEKELSGERAGRRAAEAAIRTEQRKTATVRVEAEQAAQTAQRQADAKQQAWDLKQTELTSSYDELKRELLLAQQKQLQLNESETASAEVSLQSNAIAAENADLQEKLKRAEEARVAQVETLRSLENDLAEALTRAQTGEHQLKHCRTELEAAEDCARIAKLDTSAAQAEVVTLRTHLQTAISSKDTDATAARELAELRTKQHDLEAKHNSVVEQLLQEKADKMAAEKALQVGREQLSESTHAVENAAKHRVEVEQELAQTHAEVASLNEASVSLRHQIDNAKSAQASSESALHKAQEQVGRLQVEVDVARESRAEIQEQLDAASTASNNAELEASTAQAELVMVRAQLQAAQSAQHNELAETKQELARATRRQEDAEIRAKSEKVKVQDLSSRVAALEAELSATHQLCEDKMAGLSATQAELDKIRDTELNTAAKVTSLAQELQMANAAEIQLQEKLAAASCARIKAETAVDAANAQAIEVQAEATTELQATSQELRSLKGACADAKRELEALKTEKAMVVSSPDFPGELVVDGAPTRAELNAAIELSQKLLANQTEVCTVEKQANASLHEALGDVTMQLKEAEASAARWEAATHASTQLLQHYGSTRRAEHGDESISEEDVVQYAEYLGFDLTKNPDLRWLAEEAFDAPIPTGWASHTNADDQNGESAPPGAALNRRGTPTILEEEGEDRQLNWEHESDETTDAEQSGDDDGSDSAFSTPMKMLPKPDVEEAIPEDE